MICNIPEIGITPASSKPKTIKKLKYYEKHIYFQRHLRFGRNQQA